MAEVRDAVHRHGERYLRRVYTECELRECGERPAWLAARFAAKEAAIKALDAAQVTAPWRLISVRSTPGGGAGIELAGAMQALARRREMTSLSCSMSRKNGCALAVVLTRFKDD